MRRKDQQIVEVLIGILVLGAWFALVSGYKVVGKFEGIRRKNQQIDEIGLTLDKRRQGSRQFGKDIIIGLFVSLIPGTWLGLVAASAVFVHPIWGLVLLGLPIGIAILWMTGQVIRDASGDYQEFV